MRRLTWVDTASFKFWPHSKNNHLVCNI